MKYNIHWYESNRILYLVINDFLEIEEFETINTEIEELLNQSNNYYPSLIIDLNNLSNYPVGLSKIFIQIANFEFIVIVSENSFIRFASSFVTTLLDPRFKVVEHYEQYTNILPDIGNEEYLVFQEEQQELQIT